MFAKSKRVAVFIDGFNHYYGLREKGWKRYYWLDLAKLATNIVRPDEQMNVVHYFTARVPQPRSRQVIYLEALASHFEIEIHFGKFLYKKHTCSKCKYEQSQPEEKMSDVNIALHLICNASGDVFERAILISTDSDLLGPVSLVRQRFPEKEVTVAFPPKRFSIDLCRAASSSFRINETHLRQSQLPKEITKKDGYVLKRPSKWI